MQRRSASKHPATRKANSANGASATHGTVLKQRLSKLTAIQRAMLARDLIGDKAGSTSSDGSPASVGHAQPLRVKAEPTQWDAARTVAIYPASEGQIRMWFLQQYTPESPVYNTPIAFHLRGPLNVQWLEAAFRSVIQRHGTLRTSFSMEEGGLVQRVASSSMFQMEQVNLEAIPMDERKKEADRCVQELARCPFDLAVEPQIRARLVRFDLGAHLLVVVLHHIISDGWSLGVFNRELSALYGSFCEGRDNPLEPLAVQYPDYARWQRGWLQGKELERQLAYWRKQLADAPNLDLPIDRTRPARQTYAGASHNFIISSGLNAQLKNFNRTENITPFMSLMAAFQVLLARYSGQDDILVGTPIANRRMVELENLIGFFINTLALRTDLSAQPSFREVVAHVRKAALNAYEHQDLPLDKLVEELNPKRDPSRHPLFQVLFALQNAPNHPFALTGIEVAPYRLPTYSTRFDLQLNLRAEGDTWAGTLSYNSDLFDATTIERMAGHYQTVLEAMLAEPDLPVWQLPMLTAAERHQILVEWNRTEREYPVDKCVHQLFEEQVERTPEAIAVVFEGTSLTYRELNARADQLADHLSSLGVGPDILVGLCLERSLEMVVALLGILKAGGAYVPLDPKYPKERIEFILQDAAAPVLVTQRSLGFGQRGAYPVYLDEAIPQSDGRALNAQSRRDSLAYVIYTSGSTGKPKGVAIEHHSSVSFLHWVRDSFSDAELSGLLASTSICFDLSVFEIFGPLSWGGRVLLAKSALDLWSPCAPKDVGLINTVPSVLAELLEGRGLPPSIRTVNLSGEPLRQPLVEAIFKETSAEHVNDLYGPSETTTYSTWARRKVGGVDTVGCPIANTRIYILDAHGQPMPVGIPGELHIGGAGVARGYWRRPDLTAERFVIDRFSGKPGERLFKTGDRARWLADGNVALLGRADCQVKLRGFRIELGEIETTLRARPEVREAAVIVREGTRLVAYLVAHAGEKPDASILRTRLAETLPEYMLPNALVWLEELPLTPNGKLDRKALERLDGVELAAGTEYVAPRNARERKLVEIWKAVLRRNRVGIHDNFFDLGGHSLLAIVISSRITRRLSVEVPLCWVFEHPTIERLAKRIEAVEAHPPNIGLINKVHRGEPLSMSFGQQGMWLLQQMLPDAATYNVPFAWRLRGSVDTARIRRALQAVMRRHEVLRTALLQQVGNLMQKIAPAENTPLPWREVKLPASPPNQREIVLKQRLMEEVRLPFDLAQAPLWRALWLECDTHDHVLAFTFHHSIMDEWSLRIFSQELTQLYATDGQPERDGLPDLPVQYADYSAWQRERLTGEVLARQRDFWKTELKNLPTLDLPMERVRPLQLSGRGAVHYFQLTGEVVTKLRKLAREEETTLFSVLLAAFQVWLHRYSGQTDVVVGTPVANREHREVQSLIGYFLNTLPIRTRVNASTSFREILRKLRKSLLNALGHAELPFEQMVELAVKERDPGRHLIYQAMFILVEEVPLGRLDQAEVQRLPLETNTSKNDLTLSIRATDETWDCRFEYATDLFSGDAAGRMARDLTELIGAIVNDPEQPISRLNYTAADERQQLPVKLSGTERYYADETDTAPVEKAYPLAPMQQSMLFHYLLAPNGGVYIEQLACTLRERIDLSKLREAWEKVVTRHAILRTAFRWEDLDTPVQEVRREVLLPFESADWRNCTPAAQEEQLAEFLKIDRQRGFLMNVAPLLRLTVFRRGDAHFELVWTFHHALLDGRSMTLLLKEVFAFYEASLRGEEINLPLPRPYCDFIEWLQNRDFSQSKPFWQNLLAGFTSATPLRLDRAATQIEHLEQGQEETSLSRSTTSRLIEIAEASGLTLNILVQGAWALLLHRYSGEEDIVFGAVRACRYGALEGEDAMAGLFINTVPVRARVKPDTFLLRWLQELRFQWIAMRDHEHTPLSQVQNWSEIDGGRSLFESIVVFERSSRNTILREQGGPWLNRDFRIFTKSNFPITAFAFGGTELCLQLEFDRSRFDHARIVRMLAHFRTLLEEIAANPRRRLADLSMLGEAERHQILVEWNRTEQDYPRAKCVHQLFEEQVERTPRAEAVVYEGRSMTYLELNARANCLARHLRSLGVKPDVPVGLCLERSIEMTVALLAILKAGGAYVPLDPTLPQSRLGFLLNNSACAVVVTQNSLLPILPGNRQRCETPPLYVVLDSPTFALPPGESPKESPNLVPVTAPQHLAYIMYTSGSTGQPKGVEMPHRALVNLLDWQSSTSDMRSGNRTLQFASLSFDVSFQEIFSTWISGGTLVLATEAIRKDPASLLAAIAHKRIERVFLPFVALERLAEVAANQIILPDHLKEVLVAGEPLHITPSIRRFFNRMPACRLWNHYGPTEAHVVTACKMDGPASTWPDQPPIGRPLANCQIYLLDEQRNPVSLGRPGELYVGGVCLSRGYRRRPELTADRFVAHPFSADPKERLYRTGDICRWRADGQVDYLGRSDEQVKIRGYRVELGEIETALCEVEGVREAVVVARENGEREKHLLAYVVANGSGVQDESELKLTLQTRLPDYMIPMRFEFLAALPLTPTGKVDRRALPEPVMKPAAGGETIPRNLLELELTRLWQRLFQRNDIGRHDNFFALGGYSLLAARLAAEIDTLIGCKLPIATLFQSPTIESLARRLTEEKAWAPPWSSLVPVQPLGSKPPLFFAHGWGGDVYVAVELAQFFVPEQPIYGLQAVGLDGKIPRHTSVEAMAAHYVEEIRSFQPEGPYYLGGYSMGGLIAFEMAQQLYRLGQRVAFLGLLDTTPRTTPWTVYLRTLTPFLGRRFRFHLERWWKMPNRDRFGYLRCCYAGLQGWFARNRRAPTAVTTSPAPASCDAPQVPGFQDYYWAVASAYQLRRYPGLIDVFLSDSANPALFSLWGNLARHGAILHRVPGRHLEIIGPGHLPRLANAFKTALERAQQDATRSAKVENSDASRIS